MSKRSTSLLAFSAAAGFAQAHPGHGAPTVHAHAWELAAVAAGVVIAVAVAAIFVRRWQERRRPGHANPRGLAKRPHSRS